MGTTKNILMQEFNGVDYDTLYPSIQPDFPNDLANMYIWKKWKNDFTQTEVNLSSNQRIIIAAKDQEMSIAIADDYYFDESSQHYALKNPTSITIDGGWDFLVLKTKALALCGKWCIAHIESNRPSNLILQSSSTGSGVYKVPIEFTKDNVINTAYTGTSSAFAFTGLESTYYKDGKYTLTYYGHDLTPTHTPPTDEYSRDDLGILCDKGFYGSYVGTNTQTTLTIPVPFQPNIMLLSKDNINLTYTYDSQLIWIRGVGTYIYSRGTDTSIALDGNNLLLTLNTSQSNAHYNSAGTVYYYWIR